AAVVPGGGLPNENVRPCYGVRFPWKKSRNPPAPRKRLRSSFVPPAPFSLQPPRKTAEGIIAAIGLTLGVGALAATQTWLDRHFLPSFLMTRQTYVRIETSVRLVLADRKSTRLNSSH